MGGKGWGGGTTVASTFIFSRWQTIEYLFEGSIKMEGLVIIKLVKTMRVYSNSSDNLILQILSTKEIK